jgi:hypothetical protein
MRRLRGLCMPVLVGLLLISTVVGVAGARPTARPEQQAWRVLAIHPDACVPTTDDEDYTRAGTEVHCDDALLGCTFVCAIDFPAAGEQAVGAVNVKRVTMYTYDNHLQTSASFTMTKLYPPSKGAAKMASAETADSPSDPQAVVDTSIANNPVYRVQAPSISFFMTITAKVYGFYIHYTW